MSSATKVKQFQLLLLPLLFENSAQRETTLLSSPCCEWLLVSARNSNNIGFIGKIIVCGVTSAHLPLL